MIQITPHIRIFVAIEPVDFRKGIDGLAAVCRIMFEKDPFSGSLFVFRNKKGTAIKALMYDGQGFWLFQKRLSKGRFTFWPAKGGGANGIHPFAAHELQLLIWNGNPEDIRISPVWRKIPQNI